MSCFDLTHTPVATTARAAATGPVSMSTRPDPEGSDTVEIATRRCPRLRSDRDEMMFGICVAQIGPTQDTCPILYHAGYMAPTWQR